MPDLNDFIAGLRILLKPRGIITMEFPHLLKLIEHAQFDTIYHEHFSYFSFLTAQRAFAAHGLTVFDVEALPTHGGSLRIYARHEQDRIKPVSDHVVDLSRREREAGLLELDEYSSFGQRVRKTKRDIMRFFLDCKDTRKSIAGYGAPAKGNTLLNYCGIGIDFIDYTVDLNPHKQGCFLPGTHIPIKPPGNPATQPDLVFVLPWNLNAEIIQQMSFIRDWAGGSSCAVPSCA